MYRKSRALGRPLTYYEGDLTSSLPNEWLLPRTLALASLSPNTIQSSHSQASSGLKRSRPPISSSSKAQPLSVVGLRWRLFDFGAVAAEVKRARGANAEALLQYQSSALHAAEDVEDAFSLLVQSENRRNEILLEIAELQRVRDLSEESYAAGVIALTDVLDADRQLLAAKDDLAVARESAARAAVGSYRALGGGWLP